ncbi:site-specific DNA-methyltransferase [Paraburkholderia sp. RL18-103-BIB-C]|uniref:DNA-methyltransferase n=1 Tax=Paraburkholderia sp. RL18-103-BIB-C TaxID=3031637 RepID=UPI0038B9705F
MMIVRDTFVDLRLGDCRDVLAAMPAASVDSIVCDPPYELGFMGKSWDASGIANDAAMWAECLRVLKPGAHLLAFSGSRTYHRMTCAIEDAGFEVRDQIMWIYGSGFPKSLDVSKAIDKAAGAEREVVGFDAAKAAQQTRAVSTAAYGDYAGNPGAITEPATDAAKQWAGYGTALKPAHEPICVARKPLAGTVAANVLAHGTGALNIDGCRVAHSGESGAWGTGKRPGGFADVGAAKGGSEPCGAFNASGRWPANVIHDGSPEVLAGFPQTAPSKAGARGIQHSGRHGGLADIGGNPKEGTNTLRGHDDDGGSAARFFYCPKASKADRGAGNDHPTVKPLALMAYLVRLVTPPGGVVLDPFMGSGSTGRAACAEGRDFIGIERDAKYFETARDRIAALGQLDTAA